MNFLKILTPLIATLLGMFFIFNKPPALPTVAIISYGPHPALNALVSSFKHEMNKEGFVNDEKIKYVAMDANFDTRRIPELLTFAKKNNTVAILALTTPIVHAAKQAIKDIPIVYGAVTDPLGANLISSTYKSDINITGSSDMPDLNLVIELAQKMIPRKITTMGFFYSSEEENDLLLLEKIKGVAESNLLQLAAFDIKSKSDLAKTSKDLAKVDFAYVGPSNLVQSLMPTVFEYAMQAHVPLFSAEESAVRGGFAVGSFGVDYGKMGVKTAKIFIEVLNGVNIKELSPIRPTKADHLCVINQTAMETLGLKIPEDVDAMVLVR